ncbi:MAG TPA: choice-of-anchor Q domain-containing protein [Candidatus Paceibacterota bacterium]|nr:choice-of-anchor Q domain-containing protein [Candidatus Paceibacterota bacterium]
MTASCSPLFRLARLLNPRRIWIFLLSLMLVSEGTFFNWSAIAATRYVNVNNSTPAAPYTDWSNAATNIQDAIDEAVAGDEIVVTNGVYQTGIRPIYSATNRVAVNKAVMVRSVNGPEVTQIVGDTSLSVRCVYLTNGATLIGFTLTNGAANWPPDAHAVRALSGGGAWCESVSATISNCVLVNNFASTNGGGVFSGTLYNCSLSQNSVQDMGRTLGGGAARSRLSKCTLEENTANSGYGATFGGGAAYCVLDDCVLISNGADNGGGVYNSTLNRCRLDSNWNRSYVYSYGGGGGAEDCILSNCVLTNNRGDTGGGGAWHSDLENCLLVGNTTLKPNGLGGGARECNLVNCTLVGNSASSSGGGAHGGSLTNCIVYYNSAPTGANLQIAASVQFCCTTPLGFSGKGNFAYAPLFVDTNNWNNLRLSPNSACINAGKNIYAPDGPDLDGNERIRGGTVDAGAYEFQTPISTISYAWLQDYGLVPDALIDQADSDSDLLTTWQEWIAGTIPTNTASALRMLSVSNIVSGKSVRWSSVADRNYSLERAANLGATPAFSVVKTNLAGLSDETIFEDTKAPGPGPFFYRVRVEQ